jgi:hypothetical protein
MGLPFVRPYLSGRRAEDFACGANFAVGGATALGPDFFRSRGFEIGDGRVHLDLEMKWFHDLLELLCRSGRSGMVVLPLIPFTSSSLRPGLCNSTAIGERRNSSGSGESSIQQ